MGVDVSKGHEAMDYAEHERTYKGFIRGSIALVVFVSVLLLGMLFFPRLVRYHTSAPPLPVYADDREQSHVRQFLPAVSPPRKM